MLNDNVPYFLAEEEEGEEDDKGEEENPQIWEG